MKETSESLVAFAIIGLVSGVLLPAFLKAGLGILASFGLAVGCGILVITALVIRVWIIDGLPVKRPPNSEPKQQADSDDSPDM
jgi:hypothetical protein